MYLGIEIGGTKLQLGVGTGEGTDLIALERLDIDPSRGAAGILDQIAQTGRRLIAEHQITRIGFGFGGPVDAAEGRVVTSHQIDGWDDCPLVEWCRETLGRPVVLGNDCDVAALAEATLGAGRGDRVVFFVTVGTGVGGGLVIDGRLHGSGRPAVAEIGHLRPGLDAERPDQTVESLASGRGIETVCRRRLHEISGTLSDDLLSRCGGDAHSLTAKSIAKAAADGNELAAEVLSDAVRALGWAIAQVISLIAPETVVIGGGVSLMGERLFFVPLRESVERYVFPPLTDSYRIVPTELGEEVVVHGALAIARWRALFAANGKANLPGVAGQRKPILPKTPPGSAGSG